MIRNRILLKAIAIFLIVETLINTVAPTISWALTAGPTAPEATSFEPVDTTDMVNLASGDLAYNIPLLEVPGPSGGYPLSLSYHAGIQPNEDASWTGLGWTLNPGSITRNVNGFADDFMNVFSASRFYWDGGETHTYEVGVTIGIGSAGVTAGLSYSQDTYQGSGLGMSLSVSANPISGAKLGPTAGIGISPYGDPYASAGLSLTAPLGGGESGLNASAGIGVSTNFKSVSGYASGGVGYSKENANGKKTQGSLLGASIATSPRGIAASVSVLGASSFSQNSKAGKVSISSGGASITVPLPGISISLGYRYQRYWIDQVDQIYVNGALYYPEAESTVEELNTHAYDTYSMLDLESDIAEHGDPEKLLGGSFPNFDNFYVNAQGIGGMMRPYYFQKHLVKRNNFEVRQDDDGDDYNYYKTMQHTLGADDRRAEFRFIGDFSNRFEYTPASMQNGQSSERLEFDFDWSNDLRKGESGTESYTSNVLPGSRHIEYLTNYEIWSHSSRLQDVGFIETKSTGFIRTNPDMRAIGAILITNETGVKYHFALPAMSFQEYTYSENISNTLTFNEFKNTQSYAYTWYLTAVTGPDYVDRGPNGTADGVLNEYDWGYWVEFEYGKWTDQYYWRNPSEGYQMDIDGKFKTFSEGRKELYYLDAIRTKSHTALFIKDIRDDAKSTIYSYRNISNRGLKKNKETITDVTKQGGFTPKLVENTCSRFASLGIQDEGSLLYHSRPTSALKLNEIYLFKNQDLGSGPGKTNGIPYAQNYSYSWNVEQNSSFPVGYEQCAFTNIEFNPHLYRNVMDVYDWQTAAGTALKPKAIRVIKLDTDYSLTPRTANSFDYNLVNTASPSTDDSQYPRQGKLTLNKLFFLGKGGDEVMPPTVFSYEPEDPLKGTSFLRKTTGSGSDARVFGFSDNNSGLSAGDIIRFGTTVGTCYAIVNSVIDHEHSLRILGGLVPGTDQYINWTETKNPPYDKDAYDAWGLYKADLVQSQLGVNETAARLVSPQSAQALDVWSLRTVQTAVGGKIRIEYEPDVYKQPESTISQILRIETARQKSGSSNWELVLFDDIFELDKIMLPAMNVSFNMLIADPYLQAGLPFLSKFAHRIESGMLPIYSIKYDANNKWVIETQSLASYFATRPNTESKLYLTPVLIAGNLAQTNEFENYGGGIRVSSVRSESLQATRETIYNYDQPGSENSSGVTSYEPGGLDQGLFNFPDNEYFESTQDVADAKTDYNKVLYKNFSSLLANAREIPSPGVIYEFVTVKEKVIHASGEEEEIPNYSTYQFQVFHPGMVGIAYTDYDEYEYAQPVDFSPTPTHKIRSRKVTVKNFAQGVGSLKSITLYDGAGQKISETINRYLDDGIPVDQNSYSNLYVPLIHDKFKGQGIIEETYSDARYARQDYEIDMTTSLGITRGKDAFHLLGVVTKREEYPHIIVGQTTINYKTGITTRSENLAFDFYTGQVTQSMNTDGYGNTFMTEVTPAYRVYSAMGSASAGGKNMLTQTAATYTYKIDPIQNNKKIGIVSASAETWSDQVPAVREGGSKTLASAQSGIWRKRASFSYIGDDAVALRDDGLHAISESAPVAHRFTAWTDNSTPAGWQKNAEMTLYDVYSHAVEVKDLNGQYAATKFSYDQTLVFATAANVEYQEFAYSGAEDTPSANHEFGGGVVYGNGGLTSTAHTGTEAVISTAGNHAFTYSFAPKERTYRISVWSSQPTASIGYKIDNGSAENATVTHVGQAGNWHQLEADVTITGSHTSLEVWCASSSGTTYFDDFRVCPVDAAMVSYVYNQWNELSHILDNNNLYTEYRYDNMGRLTQTYRESFQSAYGSGGVVQISETGYNYGIQDPYLLMFTASSTGTTGSVYPSGNVTVAQGRDMTFELRGNCQVSKLSAVQIDGSQINLNQSSLTLFDGTAVSINGKWITFHNVQAAHTLQASYSVNTILGTVECYGTENINGNGTLCYEGRWRYGYFNDCGVVENWTLTWYKEFIPADLRDLAEDDCCTLNLEGSGCECRH